MAEPTKYLKVVADLLALYQKELLRLFKKCICLSMQTLLSSTRNSNRPLVLAFRNCGRQRSASPSRTACPLPANIC